ncbi:malate dehydrogenase, putative [Entamoeba invadens IP1]|uniref:malate dehydrogenase, putative n=1 Tax=Entamoeba invadens IP1 TaxID=370355 RepID=UPI0002C3F457|nr:malate dehydrogenase, putative [Entamoeba invadens IP1]ELP90499.1 malate dehydrogenase, putative [Entamoeba invadens IP1]|eukprot:XP_004257270.1 malate dehydrogenase, putative [Entamoeba invadens IP1]
MAKFCRGISQYWERINTDPKKESVPIHVLVTGAAGQIGYNLTFLIANGLMFGEHQTVILHLYDVMVEMMEGVKMELTDGCFPLVKGIVASNKTDVAFTGVEVAILVAGMPRKVGMERKELISINTRIMKEQALALKAYSSHQVRVLVVANPANTNALVVANNAGIDVKQITCLTRLDQNRAIAQIAQKCNVPIATVKHVFVWGNHSEKQCPDISHAYIETSEGEKKVEDLVEASWLESFNKIVRERGSKVIEARKASSAASAAKAIVDHFKDWCLGTDTEKVVCMGIYSEGQYDVPKGIFFSMPVVCCGGEYHVVDDLVLSPALKESLKESEEELIEEKKLELAFEEITQQYHVHD